MAKKALRKSLRGMLSGLSEEEIGVQSREVTKLVCSLDEFAEAKSVGVYLTMPGQEIDTRGILEASFEDGKRVFIPLIAPPPDPTSTMVMIPMASLDELDGLPKNRFGIPEPVGLDVADFEDQPELDVIIVPGMGFSPDGDRIGHGKGYYDRYLNAMKRTKKLPTLIAVCFEEQITPSIPTDEYDNKMDYVVTRSGVIDIGGPVAESVAGGHEE